MDTKDINVIYQFNEKYVPYAGVSMTSLLINNTDADSVNIYVLGEGLSDGAKDTLKKLAQCYGRSIIFPDTDMLLAKFKDLGMIPYRGAYSVYLRLFFSELIDKSVKRALYLDSDTIVEGSLLPLMNQDMEEKSIGMVLESIRDDYKVMIGMSPDSNYYNSGMILYDVEKWRNNEYCDRLVEHIKNVRSSYIGDQDFINIVCEDDVFTLPLQYNFQPLHMRYTAALYFATYGKEGYYTASDIESAQKGAVIYHCYRWLGAFPWNSDSKHPFNDRFDRYLAKSPWQDYVKEDSGAAMTIKIERILYAVLPRAVFIRLFRIFHEKMLRRAEKDARRQKANENS